MPQRKGRILEIMQLRRMRCCGWLVPRGCETTVSRSTAGTTDTLRVEEHACRSWRCGEPGRTESWIRKVLIRYNIPWKP